MSDIFSLLFFFGPSISGPAFSVNPYWSSRILLQDKDKDFLRGLHHRYHFRHVAFTSGGSCLYPRASAIGTGSIETRPTCTAYVSSFAVRVSVWFSLKPGFHSNPSACVSCGFRLRNARNASDCVWMETGTDAISSVHPRWFNLYLHCKLTGHFGMLHA